MNSRRKFIQNSLLTTAALAMGSYGCADEGEKKPGKDEVSLNQTSGAHIGLQLYSILFILQQDFEGTLKRIAEIGYKELEFAGPYIFSSEETITGWKSYAPQAGFTDSGYYGNTPKQMKALLDKHGLTAPSAHVGLTDLRQVLPQAIEAANEIGHKYIICPFLEAKDRRSIDDYKKLADEFNRFGEACKKGGVQFGYHNHNFEFGNLDGQIPYDVLLTNTDADLVKMELDLFWASITDIDPVGLFEKHPGRFPLCHFKDLAQKTPLSDPLHALDNPASADTAKNAMADLGHGIIDFKRIIANAEKAGLKHYIVERDLTKDPETTMKEGYRYLAESLS